MKQVISAAVAMASITLPAAAQSGRDVAVPLPDFSAAASGGNWVFGTCTSYSNTTNATGFLIQGREEEWGDTITQQAGTGRAVTDITMLIFSLVGQEHPVDVQVRFFEGGGGGVEPGALIWESELFEQMTILAGGNSYNFEVPNVIVPDTFTWSLTTINVGGTPDELGLEFYDPPTQGTSENYVWKRVPPGPGGDWILRDDFQVGGEINYAATITVDCAPSCVPCDMNCDTDINALDIEFFIDLLFNGTEPCCGDRGDIGSAGDVNLDGSIDAADIEGFINCLFP